MIPLSEPTGIQPLVLAGRWVEQTLLGTTATVVATIAVSVVGLLLLRGRLPLRRGASVLIGCFVLFGSVTIATGIMNIVGEGGDEMPYSASGTFAASPPVAVATPPAQPQEYDPYAGPSVFPR